MIYKMGLIKKEKSYGYYENRNSLRTTTALGVFTGMLSFALYFVLQTLNSSVLADDVPFLMDASYFSTVFIYLAVSYIVVLIYNLVKFDGVSYSEVLDNSWYFLVQLGHHVYIMVFAKLLVQYVVKLYMYSVGFVVVLGLSSILKFPFVPNYLVSEYLAGAINILLLLLLTMTISLIVITVRNARYLIAISALLMFALQIPMGYIDIITNRSLMYSPANLLLPSNGSWYAVTMLALALAQLVFIIVRATRAASLFTSPPLTEPPKLSADKPDGTTIVVDSRSNIRIVKIQKEQLEKWYVVKKERNVLSTVSAVLMSILVTFMLVINVMLLAFNYASPEKETAMLGYIPYIFASTTMEPAVRENDIAFFEKIDRYVAVNEGDIVLFKDAVKKIQVLKVFSVVTDAETGQIYYDCDITNYPIDAIPDVKKANVQPGWVYGRLVGTNRYLGVVVLFANTVLGRLLLLLLPTLLIFYYKPILAFLEGVGKKKLSA